MYLGGYASEAEAARAYDVCAIKYWGDAAHLNFDRREYGEAEVAAGAEELASDDDEEDEEAADASDRAASRPPKTTAKQRMRQRVEAHSMVAYRLAIKRAIEGASATLDD